MVHRSLTYDHRLIDGADAGPFLRDLKASTCTLSLHLVLRSEDVAHAIEEVSSSVVVPLRQTEAAPKNISPRSSTTTRHMDKLAEYGIVTRHVDPADKRRVVVALSPPAGSSLPAVGATIGQVDGP